GEQVLANSSCLLGEGAAARLDHVDQGAFADIEAEDMREQMRQALEADTLGVAQVQSQGCEVGAERRARPKPFRSRRLERLAAAGANATHERDAGDFGGDGRDLDAVVSLASRLRLAAYIRLAMFAVRGRNAAFVRRIGMQRPVFARAGFALAFALGRLLRWLAPLAWRRARIVRRLRRQAQFCAQRRVLSPQRHNFLLQRSDTLL